MNLLPKKCRKMALCLILFAAGQTAWAADDWKSILDPLLQSGYSQIGNFNVQDFRTKAEALNLGQLSESPATVLSGSRQSGYYLCGNKPQANVVDQLPTEALSSAAQLELHELLGALCYNDANYALSTALKVLSAMRNGPAKQSLAQSYAQTIFARPERQARKGGTGVSGGGDIISMNVKNAALDLIMGDAQNRLSATDDFMVKYAQIGFEPLQGNVRPVVYLSYEFKRGGKESFAVFIPVQRWKQGESDRRELIRETARKISEVFPSYHGQAGRTLHPCGNKSITFPASEDPSVRQIQDLRAQLLLGCIQYPEGFTGWGAVAPALENPQEPRSSGSYVFNCVFTLGSSQATNQVRSRAGMGSTNSVSWNGPNGDSLTAFAQISATGDLQWTAITYHENGQLKMTPKAPSTQGTIGGQSASYSCTKER